MKSFKNFILVSILISAFSFAFYQNLFSKELFNQNPRIKLLIHKIKQKHRHSPEGNSIATTAYMSALIQKINSTWNYTFMKLNHLMLSSKFENLLKQTNNLMSAETSNFGTIISIKVKNEVQKKMESAINHVFSERIKIDLQKIINNRKSRIPAGILNCIK